MCFFSFIFFIFKDIYVILKYIDNLFLIGGKKFDFRFYVFVILFRFFKCYL